MQNQEILSCIKAISNFPNLSRTSNKSLHEIMTSCGYSILFELITTEKIQNYIINNPTLVEEWIYYTEDIRSSSAWGFGQDKNGVWIVTYLDEGKLIHKFAFEDKYAACAKMIKMTFESIRNN